VVLRFLDDYRDSLRRGALEAFEGGELTTLQENEARGRVLMCNELVALQFEHLLIFYELMPEAEETTA
jgi:hypothetical protein